MASGAKKCSDHGLDSVLLKWLTAKDIQLKSLDSSENVQMFEVSNELHKSIAHFVISAKAHNAWFSIRLHIDGTHQGLTKFPNCIF
jgi:hypothetical protein